MASWVEQWDLGPGWTQWPVPVKCTSTLQSLPSWKGCLIDYKAHSIYNTRLIRINSSGSVVGPRIKETSAGNETLVWRQKTQAQVLHLVSSPKKGDPERPQVSLPLSAARARSSRAGDSADLIKRRAKSQGFLIFATARFISGRNERTITNLFSRLYIMNFNVFLFLRMKFPFGWL